MRLMTACWIGAVMIFFTFSTTQEYYSMPIYPALALLIGSGELDNRKVAEALRLTFERRRSHQMPATLASPPADWQIPFQAAARECGLQPDLGATLATIQSFLATVMQRGWEG